jgi:hypothetical protein
MSSLHSGMREGAGRSESGPEWREESSRRAECGRAEWVVAATANR